MLILKVLFFTWLILQLFGCAALGPALGTATGAASADMLANAMKSTPQPAQQPNVQPVGAWDAANYLQYQETMRQWIKKQDYGDNAPQPDNSGRPGVVIHFHNNPEKNQPSTQVEYPDIPLPVPQSVNPQPDDLGHLQPYTGPELPGDVNIPWYQERANKPEK